MSTFYYFVCDEHDVCSQVIGGRSFPHRWWSNDEGELEQFLEVHADCDPPPVLVSEHDGRTDDYEQMEHPADAY